MDLSRVRSSIVKILDSYEADIENIELNSRDTLILTIKSTNREISLHTCGEIYRSILSLLVNEFSQRIRFEICIKKNC
ncbi:hypothetical protein Gromo_00041 [Candidatus Gromoviella agglomerans]|nr:hypothetical protein Gromo_00041 [Candidatus Gromoviella agglomerans]